MVENVGTPHGRTCAFYLCISAQQETVFSGGRGQRSRPDGRWFIYLAETLLPPACPFIFPPRMTIHDVRAFLIPSVPLPFPCKERDASRPSFLPYRRDSDREWPPLSIEIGSIHLDRENQQLLLGHFENGPCIRVSPCSRKGELRKTELNIS